MKKNLAKVLPNMNEMRKIVEKPCIYKLYVLMRLSRFLRPPIHFLSIYHELNIR